MPKSFRVSKRKRNVRGRSKRRIAQAPKGRSGLPTPFPQWPIFRKTFEFLITSAVGTVTPVTRGQLRKMFVYAESATSAYSIIDTMRVVKFEAFASAAAATNLGLLENSLEWLGAGAPGMVVREVGNPMHPIHLVSSPPPLSFAALWGVVANDADQMFSYTNASVDEIIRITVEYTESNVAQANMATGTGATAHALNFNPIGGTMFPTGLPAAGTAFS